MRFTRSIRFDDVRLHPAGCSAGRRQAKTPPLETALPRFAHSSGGSSANVLRIGELRALSNESAKNIGEPCGVMYAKRKHCATPLAISASRHLDNVLCPLASGVERRLQPGRMECVYRSGWANRSEVGMPRDGRLSTPDEENSQRVGASGCRSGCAA